MSSNLAYLVYNIMTSSLQSISFYALDTSSTPHPFNVLVPSQNTYYYFDSSQSGYTAVSFNISVNGTVILTVPLNNIQKTANTTLIVVVTLNISIQLPGDLSQIITQAIQSLFAGIILNLGCTITVYYSISGSYTLNSTNMSFKLINNSQFIASTSIPYSQSQSVSVSQIIISCLNNSIQENILQGTLNSNTCTNSSGCTYTITITFSS